MLSALIRTSLAALLVLPLAGHAQNQPELKIGVVAALTGPGSAWGFGIKNAVELAAQHYNANGGLEVGGKKYNVKVIAYDGKYQTTPAMTAVDRLLSEDHVKYIVGPMGSAPALAAVPTYQKNQVIMITLGFAKDLIKPDNTFIFRPVITTVEVAGPQLTWFVKNINVKKVGALFPNDASGQQISQDLKAAYKAAGADLVATEFFDRSKLDFVPLLTRILARGVDTIELDGNSPETAGTITKQARTLGFTGHIVRTGGPGTQAILKASGKAAAEGMYVHTPINTTSPSIKKYETMYENTYHIPMNGFSPQFYDGTMMLLSAMQKAGTVTDSAAVRDAYAGLKDYKGVTGTINWVGKETYGINHQMSTPFYIAKVVDGQEVVVAQCNTARCDTLKAK